jgi:hypothetical protein
VCLGQRVVLQKHFNLFFSTHDGYNVVIAS